MLLFNDAARAKKKKLKAADNCYTLRFLRRMPH